MASLGAGFRGIDVANVAGIRAILRHAENTENVSRLVGGGASLQRTLLCRNSLYQGNLQGKSHILAFIQRLVLRKDPFGAALDESHDLHTFRGTGN